MGRHQLEDRPNTRAIAPDGLRWGLAVDLPIVVREATQVTEPEIHSDVGDGSIARVVSEETSMGLRERPQAEEGQRWDIELPDKGLSEPALGHTRGDA